MRFHSLILTLNLSAWALLFVYISHNHSSDNTEVATVVVPQNDAASDRRRQNDFLSALRLESTKSPNLLRDLTVSDAATNYLPDGSFHLILYHPDSSKCKEATNKWMHATPVECKTFKSDTCTIYDEYFKSSSQNKLLDKTSREGRKLAFVESGGLNGEPVNSMTELFERKGWHGLVVEATPGNYVQIPYNRPCVSTIESAASPSWGPVEFFGWGGCCSGIKDAMSDGFIKAFHGKGPKSSILSYKVRSAPIVDIFVAWDKPFIDVWVLDVEGAELFVLQGMDFKAVKVGMILIEISEQPETAKLVDKMLQDAGFFRAKFNSWNNLNALYLNSAVWSV